jgi:hypothetical protein
MERDQGKGSGARQSNRIQKGKGHYGQCVHPGPFAKSKLKKKEGRICALFVNLRSAFDKVDSEKMFECLRKRERNKLMAGAEGRGHIRENKEQGEGGREKG